MKDPNSKGQQLSLAARIKAWPWKRIGLISLCVFLSLILIVMIVATAYVEKLLGSIERFTDPTDGTETVPTIQTTAPLFTDPTFTEPTVPSDIVAHKDLVNIMLVGQDRRSSQGGRTNSDVMILCSFNKQDNTITLTSFMRDLYVNIPGYGMNKMNAAYAWGGYELLGSTLMENFGVQVDHYVEVDFDGFKTAVNVLGGIDIYLTAEEAQFMNTNIFDGVHYEAGSLVAGMNHLNGDQALEYCRIRAIGYDYERTERQRKVLTALLDKCKGMNLNTALNLVSQLLSCVRTDMTDSEITGYVMTLLPLLSGEITQQRIPIDGSYTDNGSVIVPDFEINHQFLMDTLMPD